MQITIGVLYSCNECGVKQVAVAVPAREAEDVVYWLQQIAIPTLIKDHELRSPDCRTVAFSELMIPTTGVDRIGGAPRH